MKKRKIIKKSKNVSSFRGMPDELILDEIIRREQEDILGKKSPEIFSSSITKNIDAINIDKKDLHQIQKKDSPFVYTTDLTDECVTNKKLAPESILSHHLTKNLIRTAHIEQGSIEEQHLANHSIGIEKLNFNPFASPVLSGTCSFTMNDHQNELILSICIPNTDHKNYIVVAMSDQSNCQIRLAERYQKSFTLHIQRINADSSMTIQGNIFWIATLHSMDNNTISPLSIKKIDELTVSKSELKETTD